VTVVGIHRADEGYHEKWAEFLQARGVEVRWLDLLRTDALEQVKGCDAVMWHWPHYPHELRWVARPLLHVLETELRIPTFPDLATSWHYDDKIAQAYLLETCGLPQPRFWIFWRRDEAEKWAIHKASYPVVFKLACGAGSSNVRLVYTPTHALQLIREMFSPSGLLSEASGPVPVPPPWPRCKRAVRGLIQRALPASRYVLRNRYPPLPERHWMPQRGYAFFQEYVPDNPCDTRITVIGSRAFGFRRMNRPGDFRASGSGRIDHRPEEIDLRCVELGFRAAQRLHTQSLACDLLLRRGEPVIVEISYCFIDHAVQQCPGHWRPDLSWQPGSMWPQEAHVEDLLARLASG